MIVKARCLDCHKFGDKGAGPRSRPDDAQQPVSAGRDPRVDRRVPSKVISDQYKSITVATQDGKLYNGMPIVTDGPSLVLLLSDGTKATIPKAEIDEQKASATSVMPEGLLNPLSFQEIADLHGPVQLDAAGGRSGSLCRQRQVTGSSRRTAIAPALVQ